MKGVLIMLQYNIHLRTINDFRNYANMIVRFNIAGFVRVRKEEINMYDILEIMSQRPVDSMILNLTKYTPAQIPELEHYVEEANFFNDLNTEDVSNIA